MMDHKTIENRNAKAEIQLMIAEIMGNDEKRKVLVEQYHNPEKCLKNVNTQKILIGNWLNNAVKIMNKGATKEELNRIAEHIVVLLNAVKYELDIQQSYIDRDLLGLTRKYFKYWKKVGISEDGKPIFVEPEKALEKRKKMVEEFEKNREKLIKEARYYKENGMNDMEIAVIMNFPESTIRNLLKKSEK